MTELHPDEQGKPPQSAARYDLSVSFRPDTNAKSQAKLFCSSYRVEGNRQTPNVPHLVRARLQTGQVAWPTRTDTHQKALLSASPACGCYIAPTRPRPSTTCKITFNQRGMVPCLWASSHSILSQLDQHITLNRRHDA